MSIVPLLLLLGSAIAVEIKPGTKPYDPENKPYYRVDDEEQTLKLFEKFIKDYERVYDSEQEKQKRFEIFKENLHDINERNIRNPTAVFDISFSTDLTPEEFISRYSGLLTSETSTEANYTEFDFDSIEQAPVSLDWRDNVTFAAIKEQGRCNSCWAFSTICTVETQYAMKTGQGISLSEQQLVDCDRSQGGCRTGGFPSRALLTLKNMGGVQSDIDYPYISGSGRSGPCQFDRSKSKVQVTGRNFYDLRQYTEEKLMKILASIGPLSIGVDSNALNGYNGGILTNCSPRRPNHAVVLIGYNSARDNPYWLLRNSWGTKFGEQGYFRMALGSNCLGIMTAEACAAIIA